MGTQPELPTREEWLARRAQELLQSTTPTTPPSTAPSIPAVPVGPAAEQPTSTRDDSGRAWRDKLLGSGALALAGGALLFSVGHMLDLISHLEASGELAGFQVASGLELLTWLLLMPAFAIASVAFLADTAARAARLRIGALLAVAAFAATMVSGTITAAVGAAHQFPGKIVASDALGAASALALAAAAFMTAIAFASRADSALARDRVAREGRLGWANISLAVGALLMMIGTILLLTVVAPLEAFGGFAGGLGVEAAGVGIVMIAGIIAAIAFLISRQREQARLAWRSQRDGMLGIATSVFTVAFLLDVIAAMMIAGSGFYRGTEGAGRWLDAFGEVGFLAAAASASVGFFLSRRARTRIT